MNGLKKTLNVFGIIFAWLLSIALVILLTAAPAALSALSLLEPETITEAVFGVLGGEEPSAAAPQAQKSYGVVSLSAKTDEKTSGSASADDILGELDVSRIEEIIGGEIDEDVLNKVLASNAVKEIVEAYVGDVADALAGNTGTSRFSAEKITQVVEENIDEIAEIIQQVAPDLSKDDIKELKSEIKNVVRENAEDIVKVIPAPEEIRDEIIGSGAESELVLELLAQKNAFKLSIVGAIVLLSLLIFLLRLPGFRGFRWLSVDLFVAGGFGAVICVILNFGSAVVLGLVEEATGQNAAAVNDIVGNILSAFTKGVMVRTVIIFVAAIVLMAVYILLKVLRKKKSAELAFVPAAPVYAPVAPAAEPKAAPAEVFEEPQEPPSSAEE